MNIFKLNNTLNIATYHFLSKLLHSRWHMQYFPRYWAERRPVVRIIAWSNVLLYTYVTLETMFPAKQLTGVKKPSFQSIAWLVLGTKYNCNQVTRYGRQADSMDEWTELLYHTLLLHSVVCGIKYIFLSIKTTILWHKNWPNLSW